MLHLLQQITRIVGQGHLMLTLEGLRPGIGLVITGTVTGIGDEIGDIGFGGDDLILEPTHLLLEFGTHRGDLGGSPG